MFVPVLGILLAISASAHGYAGYYYSSSDCSGKPAVSALPLRCIRSGWPDVRTKIPSEI